MTVSSHPPSFERLPTPQTRISGKNGNASTHPFLSTDKRSGNHSGNHSGNKLNHTRLPHHRPKPEKLGTRHIRSEQQGRHAGQNGKKTAMIPAITSTVSRNPKPTPTARHPMHHMPGKIMATFRQRFRQSRRHQPPHPDTAQTRITSLLASPNHTPTTTPGNIGKKSATFPATSPASLQPPTSPHVPSPAHGGRKTARATPGARSAARRRGAGLRAQRVATGRGRGLPATSRPLERCPL